MGEKEMLWLLKTWYDKSRHPVQVEFDPEKVITPDIAFAILSRKGMPHLKPVYYDLLFEKLAPMPAEELLSRLSEEPVEGFFMPQLAERRTDIREALAALVVKQMAELEDLWLWDLYFKVANETLGVTFPQGALDDDWTRLMRHHEGSPGVLTWRVEVLNLSPSRVLELISEYDSLIEQQPDMYVTVFEYLLESDDPEVRRGAVDLGLANMMGKELDISAIQRLWTAGVRHPESDEPELAERKIEFLGRLPIKEDSVLFSRMGVSGSYADFRQALYGFYVPNRDLLARLFREELFRPGVLKLLNSLAWDDRVAPPIREVMREAVVRFLRKEEREPKETRAALISGLNLDLRDSEWNRVLLDYLQYVVDDPFDFPIWQLDSRHRHLLPEIQTRLDSPDGAGIALLCAGIMIQPDHPFWSPLIDRLLRKTGDVVETAHLIRTLVIVNREPDLSILSDDRLADWFDTSDKQAVEHTNTFLSRLSRPENKRLALRMIEPKLEELMSQPLNLSGLDGLFFQLPDSWSLLGESLLRIVESGSAHQKKKAASTLTSVYMIPTSIAPRLGEILKDPALDPSTRSRVLWAVARMGGRASMLAEIVREIPEENEQVRIRRAFALVSVSTDPHERDEQFKLLMEAYKRKPSWSMLRVIGLVRSMDPVTLPFFQELIRRGFHEDAEEVKAHNLEEIIYRATNFPDPEVAWGLYREVLERFQDPELRNSGMWGVTDPIFQRLRQYYPDRLAEMRGVIEQLPPDLKRSLQYRRLMERMPSR